MARTTLITGGARSGKSVYGEQLAQKLGGNDVLYVATAVEVDEEIAERIRQHKDRRPATWATEERYKDLAALKESGAFQKSKAVLYDCIGFALDNFLYEEIVDWDDIKEEESLAAEAKIRKEIDDLAALCRRENKDLIIVTNEVGDSLVPQTRVGRIFRDLLGRTNCFAASLSDSVVLMTCGLPLELKENR
jgi:adenosylcobinamide kinase / adenosylcobinamide-phosphate guanylyltransferase